MKNFHFVSLNDEPTNRSHLYGSRFAFQAINKAFESQEDFDNAWYRHQQMIGDGVKSPERDSLKGELKAARGQFKNPGQRNEIDRSRLHPERHKDFEGKFKDGGSGGSGQQSKQGVSNQGKGTQQKTEQSTPAETVKQEAPAGSKDAYSKDPKVRRVGKIKDSGESKRAQRIKELENILINPDYSPTMKERLGRAAKFQTKGKLKQELIDLLGKTKELKGRSPEEISDLIDYRAASARQEKGLEQEKSSIEASRRVQPSPKELEALSLRGFKPTEETTMDELLRGADQVIDSYIDSVDRIDQGIAKREKNFENNKKDFDERFGGIRKEYEREVGDKRLDLQNMEESIAVLEKEGFNKEEHGNLLGKYKAAKAKVQQELKAIENNPKYDDLHDAADRLLSSKERIAKENSQDKEQREKMLARVDTLGKLKNRIGSAQRKLGSDKEQFVRKQDALAAEQKGVEESLVPQQTKNQKELGNLKEKLKKMQGQKRFLDKNSGDPSIFGGQKAYDKQKAQIDSAIAKIEKKIENKQNEVEKEGRRKPQELRIRETPVQGLQDKKRSLDKQRKELERGMHKPTLDKPLTMEQIQENIGIKKQISSIDRELQDVRAEIQVKQKELEGDDVGKYYPSIQSGQEGTPSGNLVRRKVQIKSGPHAGSYAYRWINPYQDEEGHESAAGSIELEQAFVPGKGLQSLLMSKKDIESGETPDIDEALFLFGKDLFSSRADGKPDSFGSFFGWNMYRRMDTDNDRKSGWLEEKMGGASWLNTYGSVRNVRLIESEDFHGRSLLTKTPRNVGIQIVTDAFDKEGNPITETKTYRGWKIPFGLAEVMSVGIMDSVYSIRDAVRDSLRATDATFGAVASLLQSKGPENLKEEMAKKKHSLETEMNSGSISEQEYAEQVASLEEEYEGRINASLVDPGRLDVVTPARAFADAFSSALKAATSWLPLSALSYGTVSGAIGTMAYAGLAIPVGWPVAVLGGAASLLVGGVGAAVANGVIGWTSGTSLKSNSVASLLKSGTYAMIHVLEDMVNGVRKLGGKAPVQSIFSQEESSIVFNRIKSVLTGVIATSVCIAGISSVVAAGGAVAAGAAGAAAAGAAWTAASSTLATMMTPGYIMGMSAAMAWIGPSIQAAFAAAAKQPKFASAMKAASYLTTAPAVQAVVNKAGDAWKEYLSSPKHSSQGSYPELQKQVNKLDSKLNKAQNRRRNAKQAMISSQEKMIQLDAKLRKKRSMREKEVNAKLNQLQKLSFQQGETAKERRQKEEKIKNSFNKEIAELNQELTAVRESHAKANADWTRYSAEVNSLKQELDSSMLKLKEEIESGSPQDLVLPYNATSLYEVNKEFRESLQHVRGNYEVIQKALAEQDAMEPRNERSLKKEGTRQATQEKNEQKNKLRSDLERHVSQYNELFKRYGIDQVEIRRDKVTVSPTGKDEQKFTGAKSERAAVLDRFQEQARQEGQLVLQGKMDIDMYKQRLERMSNAPEFQEILYKENLDINKSEGAPSDEDKEKALAELKEAFVDHFIVQTAVTPMLSMYAQRAMQMLAAMPDEVCNSIQSSVVHKLVHLQDED